MLQPHGGADELGNVMRAAQTDANGAESQLDEIRVAEQRITQLRHARVAKRRLAQIERRWLGCLHEANGGIEAVACWLSVFD